MYGREIKNITNGNPYLSILSTDQEVIKRIPLDVFIDAELEFVGLILNADFATSNDGSLFLVLRPGPKLSYYVQL